jgi:type II secretory pathway component PulF
MATYTYTAVDDLGQRIRGSAVADSEDHLEVTLAGRGQHLVRLEAPVKSLSQVRIFDRITPRDVIFFTSQLATVIGTGVNLVDGLNDIESRVRKAPMQKVLKAVRDDIEKGSSLSQAVSRHPSAFDDFYVNVVRAGEATGSVDRTLEDLVRQLEWREDLKNRMREVTTYPLIVVGLLTIVMTVFVSFTIPRVMRVYEQMQSRIELPLPTLVIVTVATLVQTYWLVILAALAVAFIAVRLQAHTEHGRARQDHFILRLPLVGEVARKVALSRFAHYLGTLHQAGLEVAPSLTLVERLIGNAWLSRQFRRAVGRVTAGESLSGALAAVGEFPPIVIQMIAIGERTGRMSKALEHVRIYYDKEVDRTIRRSLTLFGPVMMIVLASVFVLMALAYYLPLFRLLRVIPVSPQLQ